MSVTARNNVTVYMNDRDELHRTDGPAFIRADGFQSWWLLDCRYYDNNSYREDAHLDDEQMEAIIAKYGNVS